METPITIFHFTSFLHSPLGQCRAACRWLVAGRHCTLGGTLCIARCYSRCDYSWKLPLGVPWRVAANHTLFM
jgi:hypothetical protein